MKIHVLRELLRKQGFELLDVYRYPSHDVLRIIDLDTRKVYKVELPAHKESLDEDALSKALENKQDVSAKLGKEEVEKKSKGKSKAEKGEKGEKK